MARILIFSSNSGAGHQKAVDALSDALGRDHSIMSIPLYERHSISYNRIVRFKLFALVRALYLLWDLREWFLRGFATRQVEQAIASWGPDLVMSVSRGGNGAIWDVCQEKHLPFVLVPTDMDVRPFVRSIKNPTNKFTLFLTDFCQYAQLTHVKKNLAKVTGFPVQKYFLTEPTDAAVLDAHNIHADRPIILCQGYDMVADVRYLSRKFPDHDFVCLTNRDEGVADELYDLEVDNVHPILHVSSENMALLMSRSRCLLTKAGGSVTGEAMTVGLPMIIRSTEYPWEAFNAEFIRMNDYGYYWPGKVEGLESLIREIKTRHAGHITKDFQKNVRHYVGQILGTN